MTASTQGSSGSSKQKRETTHSVSARSAARWSKYAQKPVTKERRRRTTTCGTRRAVWHVSESPCHNLNRARAALEPTRAYNARICSTRNSVWKNELMESLAMSSSETSVFTSEGRRCLLILPSSRPPACMPDPLLRPTAFSITCGSSYLSRARTARFFSCIGGTHSQHLAFICTTQDKASSFGCHLFHANFTL